MATKRNFSSPSKYGRGKLKSRRKMGNPVPPEVVVDERYGTRSTVTREQYQRLARSKGR